MKSITLRPLLLIFLTFPLAAEPSEVVEGHRFPKQLESHEQTWTLQGTHHFRYKVFFSVFAAGLYTTDEPDGKRLSFTYTRNLKADDLRDQAMKTLKANNSNDIMETYRKPTTKLQTAYRYVKEGDTYTLTVITDKGIWLHLNDKEIYFHDNSTFGYWYLDIWLGDPPISDDLKSALTKGLSR
ncbi:MAG: chalcone isomerase family protein [Kiritimatiellae bacterium]|jgi:hypothetical protein|nr:chalcone isomerase family protein [Kiritimatiellia bacterium]